MRLLLALATLLPLLCSSLASAAPSAQQLDPDIRDRVIGAAVQVAIDARWTETDGDEGPAPITIGSGTIVSPDGYILTNAHVVDELTRREIFSEYQSNWLLEYPTDVLDFFPETMFILASDGIRPPKLQYLAEIIEVDEAADLAVLKIIDSAEDPPYPFIPLGDSSELRLGDPVHVFGYPMSGGDALTYTTGVVSGFNYENPDDELPAWINTDAVVSGGNSGGTAVNAEGDLIGIPTQGSRLDCRPGDTNGDGEFTSDDVGCIPTGGSIGQLRPSNMAVPILARARQSQGRNSGQVNPTSTPVPAALPPTQVAEADWTDFVDTFSDPIEVMEDGNGIFVTAGDGAMRISLASADLTSDDWFYTEMPSQYGDYAIALNISDTFGEGEVLVAVTSESEGHRWVFAVDPVYDTWALWRLNTQGTQFFYWIEPRILPGSAMGPLSRIEVQVMGGVPHLLVNGVDVSAASGLEMPVIGTPRFYAWGARSTISSFDLIIDEVQLRALP